MNGRDPDVERLEEVLHAEFGDRFRSCVEYRPSSSTIHYLHPGIDRSRAEGRLVRIEELYHAERLSAQPLAEDAGLGALSVSIHVFDGAVVLHFVEEGGYVIGVSVAPEAATDLNGLVETCADALYGDTPAVLDPML